MASKKKLTADNLEQLGPRRLAELLMDIAGQDAATKRRLRLELAVRAAPEVIAGEVRKRLVQLARGRSFLDGRKIRGHLADLETERRMIVDQVAKIDAAEALELMWRFMDLAGPTQERCDDSNGVIGDVFAAACRDLAPLAQAAKPDPVALADRVFEARNDNGHGQYDELIAILAPALGGEGLDHLKACFLELSKVPVEKPAEKDRTVIGWGPGGRLYRDEIEARSRQRRIRLALQEIADAQGDVDAFAAQYDEAAKKAPGIAAEIAGRLVAAGRAAEALAALDAADYRRSDFPDFAWEDARIAALDALGRGDDAQALRWGCFERWLSDRHLRAYLKRLPDFDDLEAEERAFDHAERSPKPLQALAFLVAWPALERAERLVIRRAATLDGDRYETLTAAADALAAKHPLAATLVLRAMIDFALTKSRYGRYKHAAQHLMECARLAGSVTDFGTFETHEAYAARLKSEHGYKSSFWSLIA